MACVSSRSWTSLSNEILLGQCHTPIKSNTTFLVVCQEGATSSHEPDDDPL